VVRGARGPALADAVQLATARAAGATAFVTNDRRMGDVHGLEVLFLDDLAPAR
jgi:predicted nucleic acid-binding protein